MLTSDFGNYSEITTDSLNSESSQYFSSEIDTNNSINEQIGDGTISAKKRSKTRPRSHKKVKYWTLPTMSTGTFNPSMLTARQQLQYLAQKSKLGEESDSLELSPLRLDRIKFEEMKSMSAGSNHGVNKEQNESGFNIKELTSPKTPSRDSSLINNLSSPSPRNSSRHQQQSSSLPARGSKLKEEIASSPTRKLLKSKKSKKTETVTLDKSYNLSVSMKDKKDTTSTSSTDIPGDNVSVSNESICSSSITENSVEPAATSRASFFGTVKGLLFDYKETRRNHFETFLKDFAKRLGLSPDNEIIKKKREEIINKGMI